MAQSSTLITERSQFGSGVLFALAYVVLSAGKGVYVGHLVQNIHPMLVSFACFSVTALFFNLTQPQVHRRGLVRKHWKDVCSVNLTSMGAWVGFYYALKDLEPAVTTCIVMGSGPAATTLLLWGKGTTFSERLSALGVSLGIVYLCALSLSGGTAFSGGSSSHVFFALIAATLAGVSAAGNTIGAKKLYQDGFQPNEVMAIRFYGLLLVSGGIVLFEQPELAPLYSQVPGLLMVSAFGLMLPLACMQYATQRLDPMPIAFLSSLLPLFMLPLQMLDDRLAYSWASTAGVLVTVGFVCWGVLARFRSMMR